MAEDMAGYMRTARVEIWELHKCRRWRHGRDAVTQRKTAVEDAGLWKKMRQGLKHRHGRMKIEVAEMRNNGDGRQGQR